MLKAYLDILDLPQEEPSKRYLFRLFNAQIHKFVVENLDYYYHRKPLLEVSTIWQKVSEGRGGIPLHLNALFFHILKQLGFKAALRSTHSFDPVNATYAGRLSGISIHVSIDGESYFINVADIKGLVTPLRVKPNQIALSGTHFYRWEEKPFDDHIFLSKSKDAALFTPHLQVESRDINLIEYLPVDEKYQSPTSEMSSSRWLFCRRPNGYVYLMDDSLEISELGQSTFTAIENEEAFWSLAVQHFGISREMVFNPEAGI